MALFSAAAHTFRLSEIVLALFYRYEVGIYRVTLKKKMKKYVFRIQSVSLQKLRDHGSIKSLFCSKYMII